MSRRDKVLAYLADADEENDKPAGQWHGSVAELAEAMGDPSPQALSATISVLVKDGLVGREPEGIGVVATRLWLVSADQSARDTSRADTPPDAEPEVARCPHGIPLEAAAKLCTTCKAADRQRRSRATRRAAEASEPVEEPEARPVAEPSALTDEQRARAAEVFGRCSRACSEAHTYEAGCQLATVVLVHACPPKGSGLMPCCGLPPGERMADRMTTDPAQVTCRAIVLEGLDELEARMEPVPLIPGRIDGLGPDGERVLCAPACEQACQDGCDLAALDEPPPSRVVQTGRPARRQRSLRADLADQLDMEADRRVLGATLLIDMAVERFLADLLPFEVATAVRRADAEG